MQIATGLQAGGQFGHQRGLDEAALVVLGFVPGVGEENVHTVQAGGGQHVVQHLNGVVLQDADVVQALLAAVLQQRAHAGFVHLAAQEVVMGPGQRDFGGGVAHAKPDFQHQRCGAAKGGGGVQRGVGGVVQQKLGAKLLKRLHLARAHAPRAQHVAFDGAQVHAFGRRLVAAWVGGVGRLGGCGGFWAVLGVLGHGAASERRPHFRFVALHTLWPLPLPTGPPTRPAHRRVGRAAVAGPVWRRRRSGFAGDCSGPAQPPRFVC